MPSVGIPQVGIAETAEYRTKRFRNTKLTLHVNPETRRVGKACVVCHFAPYECFMCGGTKCQCKLPQGYRHWENGVPIATMAEQKMLEEVDL